MYVEKMQASTSNASKAVNLSLNSPTSTSWFAVFTVHRHEKRVEAHFHLREIDSFLPLYKTTRQWKDRSKHTLQLPLFPSYIFVRIDHSRYIPVLQVPGVISIVGGRRPLPVPDSYIDSLREGLDQGKIEPHDDLTVGTKVRICSGAMIGHEGVLLRKKNNFHVVLRLDVIMKSVTVEVNIKDVEPVPDHLVPGEPRLRPTVDRASLLLPGKTLSA